MSLLGRAKELFEAVRGSPARVPEHVRIGRDRVDDPAKLGSSLIKDGRYFQVRVNEMFLASERVAQDIQPHGPLRVRVYLRQR